jgi:hypothetical protein
VPIVSFPDAMVARLAGAHAFGEGDGAGDGEAVAGLGLTSGLAATLAAGLGDGAGVGVAAPLQAASSAPVSASAAANRIEVLMVRRLSSVTGPARVYPSGPPGRAMPGRDTDLRKASAEGALG